MNLLAFFLVIPLPLLFILADSQLYIFLLPKLLFRKGGFNQHLALNNTHSNLPQYKLF